MRFGYPLVVLPLLLVSCASTPQAGGAGARHANVDARAVARSIVLCRTTETELRRQLGEPSRDGILHGQRVMTWIFRTETPSTYIGVLLDERGVVVDLYWDVPTEVPWVPAGQCSSH
jgi:hypothetical protein